MRPPPTRFSFNTKMNYWPAEITNLAECAEPLFAMIEDLSHTGAKMARDHYGAGGWVAHHNTDLWRATGPVDGAFWGPSNQITLRETPALAAAVKKTLETRGDISTGWAIAWRLNLWAGLQDAERACRILAALLGPGRTYPKLCDAHPPFQIDGNFGGAAGIAEMLLQSHAGEIELLPALPKAWPTGSARGLRARGGFTIGIEWREGRLTSATLQGPPGRVARLRHGKAIAELTVPASGTLIWNGDPAPATTP